MKSIIQLLSFFLIDLAQKHLASSSNFSNYQPDLMCNIMKKFVRNVAGLFVLIMMLSSCGQAQKEEYDPTAAPRPVQTSYTHEHFDPIATYGGNNESNQDSCETISIKPENVDENGNYKEAGHYKTIKLIGNEILIHIKENEVYYILERDNEEYLIEDINDPKEIIWGASFGGEDTVLILTKHGQLYQLDFVIRSGKLAAKPSEMPESGCVNDVIIEPYESAIVQGDAQYTTQAYKFYAVDCNGNKQQIEF
ncbi:MAG: hypothetical protein IKF46_04375 [Erysipelotrichaceae bacterium]|nr:hypothetical protein [Erysipelotrichaceae bacterium]